jgi:hypothetical protein
MSIEAFDVIVIGPPPHSDRHNASGPAGDYALGVWALQRSSRRSQTSLRVGKAGTASCSRASGISPTRAIVAAAASPRPPCR